MSVVPRLLELLLCPRVERRHQLLRILLFLRTPPLVVLLTIGWKLQRIGSVSMWYLGILCFTLWTFLKVRLKVLLVILGLRKWCGHLVLETQGPTIGATRIMPSLRLG